MEDFIKQLGYLAGATRFRRISEKLHTDGDKIYQERGINFRASWFSVFYLLSDSDEPKTVVELANEIGFTHITVKNVLRELENAGLVEITDHPTDKRSRHNRLSVRGKQLHVELQKIWKPFGDAIKQILDAGHPDFLNIINRIDAEIYKRPIHEIMKNLPTETALHILDYSPGLKPKFFELINPWLNKVFKGKVGKEQVYALDNPDQVFLQSGGFVFFAKLDGEIVGTVALKRLDSRLFEISFLFVDPELRRNGIATKLLERCISRCRENEAMELWVQALPALLPANQFFEKLGFADKKTPKQMSLLHGIKKAMAISLK